MKCNISTQSSDGFNGDLGLDIHLHDIVSKEGSFEDILYHMLLSAKLSFSKTIASMNSFKEGRSTLDSFHLNLYIHNAKGDLNVKDVPKVNAAFRALKDEECMPYKSKIYFTLSIQNSNIENLNLMYLLRHFASRSLEIINSNGYNICLDYYNNIEIKESNVVLESASLYSSKGYKGRFGVPIYVTEEAYFDRIMKYKSSVRDDVEQLRRQVLAYKANGSQNNILILSDGVISQYVNHFYSLIGELNRCMNNFYISNSSVVIKNSLLNAAVLYCIEDELNLETVSSSPVISVPVPGNREFKYFYWEVPDTYYYSDEPTDTAIEGFM